MTNQEKLLEILALKNNVLRYVKIKRDIKKYQELLEEYKQKIITAMHGEEKVTSGDYEINNKIIISRVFDSNKFKQEHQDLYDSYKKENITTRFEVNLA